MQVSGPSTIPFIVLNFATMKECSETEKMSTIAHEIVHFIRDCTSSNPKEKDEEKEADDLIEK